MSIYKFKDFTSTLNVKNNRYYYEYNGEHCIHAIFSENDNVYTITAQIEKMRVNAALSLLEKSDYRWDGSTTIIFKEKNHAALFYIYCL